MKKIALLFIIYFLAVSNTVSQINTIKINEIKDKYNNPEPYDSLKNFVGSYVRQYIGQDLYLEKLGKQDKKLGRGYSDFYLDYNKGSYPRTNIYKCCSEDGRFSSYKELENKYFNVIDVVDSPEKTYYDPVKSFYLKLKEKESGDILYFHYRILSETRASNFPFLVVGYFEKIKKSLIGNDFVFFNHIQQKMKKIDTSENIEFKTGDKWSYSDFAIDDNDQMILVIKSSSGQIAFIPFSIEWNERGRDYFSTSEYNTYLKKFGQVNMNLILNGEVRLGMTKEMCKMSLGTPYDINTTTLSNKKLDQWVYGSDYYYFDNNILTAIQD